MDVDSQPRVLPHLPVEVIGLVAEQLSSLGLYGTLANVNITCKCVRRETLPAMWKRVIATRLDQRVGKYSSGEYERLFRARYGAAKYYKYIQYVIDEEGLVKTDTDDDRHDSRLDKSYNPFRQATFLGFRFQHAAFDIRNPKQQIEEPICLVRLGADYVGFTDDMLDTLQSEIDLDQLMLGDSSSSCAGEKLHIIVPDFVKPTRAVPTTPARMKALLDYSPPGWIPSSPIDQVHVFPQYRQDPSDFDHDYLRNLTLEMLNLLAVSVGKQVLLQTNGTPNCNIPVLIIRGLRLKDVDAVVDMWFSVAEHCPCYAGIKLSLVLGGIVPHHAVATRFQQWKERCSRYCQKQEDARGLKLRLENVTGDVLAVLGETIRHYDTAEELWD